MLRAMTESEPDPPQGPGQSPTVVPLHVIQPGYTALLVTGVMVPVAGAIGAFVALGTSGVRDAARLAVTVPITELTASGSYPVFLVLAGLLYAWVISRVFPARSKGQLVLSILALVFVSPVFGLIVGSSAGLPLAVSLVAFSSVVFLLGRYERYRPIRGRGLAIALAAMYVLAAVSYGLTEPPLTPLLVEAPDAPVGYSLRVGEDSDWLYLIPCNQRDQVIQVPKSSIRSIAWAPRPAPLDFLTNLTQRLHAPSIFLACP